MDFDNSVIHYWNQTIDEDPEEVLRDSANASEKLQHEQVPQPLKFVVEEESYHSNICEDETPKEGMCFESCFEAHGFHKNYASKAKHTHPCSPQKSIHYHEYWVLSLHAKCVIENNDEAGIRHNKTYLVLSNEVGDSSNPNFLEKDVRNYIFSKLRTTDVNLEVKEMLMYFNRMKEINLNFFYEVEVDENYMLKSAV
ncbi:hypothetical protein PIB30_017120 [Stylosanthes scabra]|uniref:Uncharacterized protein n=1 Tax=Stylosanthes scabra TaxID=79078 RepID=A0ABU6U9B3_9FABA|nr:hypothetical protein [Stylosanthes scabra]